MNAGVADILREAGFVPVVPEPSRKAGTPESKAASHVPVAPAVPIEKCKGVNEPAKPGTPDTIRARLFELAAIEYRDPALVLALSASFLRDCGEMGDDALRALLSMLADDADRQAGRVPKGDTSAILCRNCGPVFVHPSIAAVLPVVNGWPRALGCPWCFVHPPEGMQTPRPHVTCATCQHYQPDSVNPGAGMGRCLAGVPGMTWPNQSRKCKAFKPREAPHE